MKKFTIILLTLSLFVIMHSYLFSQVSISDTASTADASAMLEVKSTDKGILIPRMTYANRILITSPAEGLIVYQTDIEKGFYYYDGTSWQYISGNMWSDGGNYICPASATTVVHIADNPENTHGIYTNTNTGVSTGYGGFFNHANSSGSGTGLFAKSEFTGTENIGVTKGADIRGLSNKQDLVGLSVYSSQTSTTGTLYGLYNQNYMATGNINSLYGMYNYSARYDASNINYGLYSRADTGSYVYGIYGKGLGGTINYGVYGYADTGSFSYGVCGISIEDGNGFGVYGESNAWGGYFNHSSSGKYVKLGGSTYAIKIVDGNEAAGKTLISDNDGNAAWQTPSYSSPGGSTNSIQYNNMGSFSGATDFVWDNTNKRLGIGTGSPVQSLDVNGNINIKYNTDALKIANFDVLHRRGSTANIFLGTYAGSSVSGTEFSTFVGYEAGRYDTASSYNTFVGSQAGFWSRKNMYNTYLGSYSGYNNTVGNNNTSVGYRATFTSNGSSENTVIGSYAGHNNTTGGKNTFVGFEAGYSTTTGGSNTYIGTQAGYSSNLQVGNVFIGYRAGYNETSNYKLFIDNSDTSNPLIYGEFNNNLLRFNGRVGVKTAPNSNAGFHVSHDDLYSGYFTTDKNSGITHVLHAEYTGTNNYDAIAVYGESRPVENSPYGVGGYFKGNYIGVRADSDAGSAIGYAYGVFSICSGTDGHRYGVYGEANGGSYLYGVYGKATAQTNSYGIYCDGNGVYSGTWASTSDGKLKTRINNIESAIDKIMQLEPKSYHYKTRQYDYVNLARGKHYGFVAQDLEKVFPELVGTASVPKENSKNPEMENFKTVNYIEIIPVLTGAIQEQQQTIEELRNEVEELRSIIETINK